MLRELARRLDTSEAYLARGVDEEPALPDTLLEAEIALRLGDVADAEALYEAGLAIAPSGRARAAALAGLGHVALHRDEFERAVEHFEAALAADREVEDATLAEALGRAYGMLGDRARATALFERRLAGARARRDAVEEFRFAVLLANAVVDDGDFGRAEQLLADALRLAEASGDPLTLARLYWSQSRLYALERKPAVAARYARRALGILEATEHTRYTAQAYHLLASIELDRGRGETALELLDRGEQLIASTATAHERGKFALEKANALVRLDRADEAVSLALDAAGLLGDGDPVEAGRSYAGLAGALADVGERERAIELYELGVGLLDAVPNRYLAGALTSLSRLYEESGDTGRALTTLKRAAGLPRA